jgi:hypothetical protein
MLKTFLRALLLWLLALETLAQWRGWKGLSWLGRRAPAGALALVLPALLAGMPVRKARRAMALALSAPLALGLQIAASSLRNQALNPLHQLRAGRADDRTIERLDIPMREGYLPALHVMPDRMPGGWSTR